MAMIDVFDFDLARPRTMWFDANGLLKAPAVARRRPSRPRRKRAFTACVAGAALVLCVVDALALQAPAQTAIAWPHAPTIVTVQEALKGSLDSLRKLGENWDGHGAPAPIERSISAAEYILPQLPALRTQAVAGVNDEGNVLVRMRIGPGTAYLTVEPKLMHLLYMVQGRSNVYIDDADFNGKVIPSSILRILREETNN